MLNSFIQFKNDLSEQEKPEIFSSVKYWINKYLEGFGNCLSFLIIPDNDSICTVCLSNSAFPFKPVDLTQALSSFIRDMSRNYNIGLSIGISRNYTDFSANAAEAYRESKNVGLMYFYFGFGLTLLYEPENGNYVNYFMHSFFDVKKISVHIANSQADQAAALLTKAFSEVLNACKPRPQTYKYEICNILYFIGINVVSQQDKEFLKLIRLYQNKINAAPSVNEVNNLCIKYIFNLQELLTQTDINANDRIINICKDYISTHFKQPISLETMAAELHFNANYFSIFFKKHAGANFSNYVLGVRLENAKALLLTTDKKIYEIAEECGIHSVKYFNRVFKQYMGITPVQFRHTSLR